MSTRAELIAEAAGLLKSIVDSGRADMATIENALECLTDALAAAPAPGEDEVWNYGHSVVDGFPVFADVSDLAHYESLGHTIWRATWVPVAALVQVEPESELSA